MGQDSKTGGQGLYVETIEIDPEGGENVVFACNAWSEDDDLKSQKDIYPEPEASGEPKASTFSPNAFIKPNHPLTGFQILYVHLFRCGLPSDHPYW
jgi:hypothetical protein